MRITSEDWKGLGVLPRMYIAANLAFAVYFGLTAFAQWAGLTSTGTRTIIIFAATGAHISVARLSAWIYKIYKKDKEEQDATEEDQGIRGWRTGGGASIAG